MKKYKAVLSEGIDSIPEVERALVTFFKKGKRPSDVLGSFIAALQTTKSTNKISDKAWNSCIDSYYALNDDEQSEE
jgi:hypothetical protein